ncbi:MAG: mechanosensitive ion channel [Vicinamibacteria bacterium]|nr:mechanosensitive ion channel [Vicinamibacteria bacterium]
MLRIWRSMKLTMETANRMPRISRAFVTPLDGAVVVLGSSVFMRGERSGTLIRDACSSRARALCRIAGLLAAAGVAIGIAWSGLLSNIAAGVFMVALRPFKKGDNVQIGGVYGAVEELGLFGTTLTAPK